MDPQNAKTERIVIAIHPTLEAARVEAGQIAAYLKTFGISEPAILPVVSEELRRQLQAGKFDVLLAVGGDGTMLRASHLCSPLGVPILGINTGHLGFLMEVQRDQWRELLPRLLQGDYRRECRMTLQSSLMRDGKELKQWQIINDVVVCRGHQIKPIRLQASVDGNLMAEYVADGLIIATPTGSTAYAMAAGGPILSPELRNILLMPVAPHLSLDRAVLFSERNEVTIDVLQENSAVISADGQAPFPLEIGDQVITKKSPHSLCYIRFHGPDYFYRNLTRLLQKNMTQG